ncbi:type 1 glutamine amidotransferase [Sedimentitalea nanhaiensis]|uniref:GMP synthase-Glutamine amidotransferase n=1 Tax=Sedimentitalea nanhaiensis TaxID=999627 RepID=A0A1I6ZFD5_9RHOB|nr:type 1 glutamine amidotransferase [Sedimentitalea nanhaiensis]SFT61281.1 GMP synthase-Glutamine amidotransferase [Sedimentitalea nanhaiensis]
MKIGILLTGHAPDNMVQDTGDYDHIFAEMLAGQGFEFETFAVVDNQFPDGADAADGWLITGSKHGAYEDHPWIQPLEALIRDIAAEKRPLVGICFGHQIIAQALGGKVEKFEGGWAVGRTDYRVGDQTLSLNAWHQDQVVELPPGARVLGGNDFCKYAVLEYGDTIWTLQPHPEFNATFVDGLIRTRGRGVVPDDLLDAATANLNGPNNNRDIAVKMAAVFKGKPAQ